MRRLQIGRDFRHLHAAAQHEAAVELAGDTQRVEPGCGDQHGQLIADGAERAFCRQSVAGCSQLDIRLAQALPGEIDFAVAGQLCCLSQAAVLQLKTECQRELWMAAALHSKLGIEVRCG
ncbi:MAG: hypothetical protein CAPSK01_000724 [Candidatus Accumulibacter vicinus]|uniref:Uncharacterized protein n=1 Tax=Candidatus Accumulibacter vicinus TaxID=2954382 RepID=A0A084Y4M1_9PROT|nr:MAG: hypothetical protein CAPSK01_000724 [Candidatus Accumulibacter vicinus]